MIAGAFLVLLRLLDPPLDFRQSGRVFLPREVRHVIDRDWFRSPNADDGKNVAIVFKGLSAKLVWGIYGFLIRWW